MKGFLLQWDRYEERGEERVLRERVHTIQLKQKKTSITTQIINSKTHIHSVAVDNCKNNYIGEIFFYYNGTGRRKGEGRGFYGSVVHI